MTLQRWIMHVDMDAFFASVEVLDEPSLRGLPVIVGGRSVRGVVSTCSYEARRFGVHSAMPLARARQLCPEGVFLPGRMQRYAEVSRQIMAIFRELSPLVEQLSIDEAFLDFTGTERLYGSAIAAGRLVRQRIAQEVGLTASVGLAPNKFLAKLASDLEKPDGFTVIRPEQARSFIAPLPVSRIFGVGRTAQQELQQLGIEQIGQLAVADLGVLRQIFGKNAVRVQQLAQGLDERPVVNSSEPQSIGRETTFEQDLHTAEECRQALLQLSEQVGYRLRRKGYCGRTLTLKLKYADFQLLSRSLTVESDIVSDEHIYELVVRLLGQLSLTKGVRLLGITVSGLTAGGSTALCFEEEQRSEQRSRLTDALKARFGEGIIHRGRWDK